MAGVQRFEDLVAWRLLFELSVAVWKLTDGPPASRDFKYRDQVRDSSDSAQRNVSEGFGRFSPGEFARFLDIARGSANETRALLIKGRAIGYLTEAEFERLDALSTRGLQALSKLQRYLRSADARRNARRYRGTSSGRPTNQGDPHDPSELTDPNDGNDRHDPNSGNNPNSPNDVKDPNNLNDVNTPNVRTIRTTRTSRISPRD
jgi:four helix bundle protein